MFLDRNCIYGFQWGGHNSDIACIYNNFEMQPICMITNVYKALLSK